MVLTRAAQDLYAAGDQTLAAQSAQALLARTPSVDAAKQRIGWTIIGQVSFNQGEFAQAENAFTHALAVAAAKDPERPDITERLAAAIYKQGEAKRKAGDQARRGRGLPARGARRRRARSDRDRAIRCRGRADQRRAVASRDRGAARPIGAIIPRASTAPMSVASSRWPMSRPAAPHPRPPNSSASPAIRSEDPAVVHEALAKAADLYQQSGNPARSVAMLERLVRDYPTPVPDAIEVRERLSGHRGPGMATPSASATGSARS